MRTYIDCVPCFFKQVIEACNVIGVPESKTRQVLNKLAERLPDFSLDCSPPQMAAEIHRTIRQTTGIADPYELLKKKSNELASAVYPELQRMVQTAPDRLLKAVEIAIAGNIIDYGAVSDLDIMKEINTIIQMEENRIERENDRFFAFNDFKRILGKSKCLLYLADNAGEIYFDRILIEEIKSRKPELELCVAVRGAPVLNDCTMEDARQAGIGEYADILSNGHDAPGTVLCECSKEFLAAWEKADMIISKGQGNFESLSDDNRVFFLFIAKCEVVVKHMGCSLRDTILYTT